MFVRSVPVSYQILGNCMVVRYETCQLVFFGKKLEYKLVFDISVYHLAPQNPLYCLNFLRYLEQFGFELRLFDFFFEGIIVSL